MSLRKWHSNSPVLKEHLKALKFDVSPEMPSSIIPFKVLGLIWDTDKDVFRIDNHNLSEFVNCREKTKRTVIRASGRIFDPIGFLSPYTIRIKILFQSLWERGIDWDQNLPEDLEKDWDDWCAQLPYLSRIEVPRYHFCDLQGNFPDQVELHCFTDASEKAYGAIIYFRFHSKNSSFKTILVTSKSRLAPIKRLSLPRLELMGALIGARLINNVTEALNISSKNIFMWTDSNIVLHWIQSSSGSWKPFVSNRVSEIQTLTNPMNWRHCPGRDNPADRLTRGLSILDLERDNLWWSGPQWLTQGSELWPEEARDVEENVKMSEARWKVIDTSQCFCTSASVEPLLEIENFSSLSKFIRRIAWIKRFIYNLRNSIKRKECLSAEELQEAEMYIIRYIQGKIYAEEIEALKRNYQISKKSKIYSLCPYLDEENVLRIGSRLNQGNFSPNEINPIILPKSERFTELLVKREHERVIHSGVTLTLTQIRKNFWIPKGRQLVKKIISKCLICKKYNAKPASQITGQLPKERISEAPPFSIIGVDFAGPICIKNGKSDTSKAYIECSHAPLPEQSTWS